MASAEKKKKNLQAVAARVSATTSTPNHMLLESHRLAHTKLGKQPSGGKSAQHELIICFVCNLALEMAEAKSTCSKGK